MPKGASGREPVEIRPAPHADIVSFHHPELGSFSVTVQRWHDEVYVQVSHDNEDLPVRVLDGYGDNWRAPSRNHEGSRRRVP